MYTHFSDIDKLVAEKQLLPVHNPQTLADVSLNQGHQKITQYAEDLGNQYNMSADEVKHLHQDINYALLTGKISKTDILMENQRIVEIEDATIDDNMRLKIGNESEVPILVPVQVNSSEEHSYQRARSNP